MKLSVLILAVLLASVIPSVLAQPGPIRAIASPASFPSAVAPEKVGKYAKTTAVGGGVFYDDVLEYRVWMHDAKGERTKSFVAFGTYESAAKYSRETFGTGAPQVLVRQTEWILESSPGTFVVARGDRLTEWRVEWLVRGKRNPESVREFLRVGGKGYRLQ